LPNSGDKNPLYIQFVGEEKKTNSVLLSESGFSLGSTK
jgi:hypothetical protein